VEIGWYYEKNEPSTQVQFMDTKTSCAYNIDKFE
jgi:hypothetical protein